MAKHLKAKIIWSVWIGCCPFFANAQADFQYLSPKEKFEKAEYYYESGARAVGRSQFRLGEVYFDSAIMLRPKKADFYLARGEAREEQKEVVKALADYETTIRLDPEHLAAKFKRALIYFERKNYIQAVKDYSALLKIEEVSETKAILFRGVAFDKDGPVQFAGITTVAQMKADIYHARALAYQKLGYKTPTMKDFRQAILLNPKDANIYLNRGLFLKEQNNIEGAVADFRKAIALDPYNKNALFNLSFHVDEEEKDAIYKKLYGEGDRALFYSRRAFENYQKGQLDDALADYDSALLIRGDRAEDLMNRGMVKAKLDKHTGAIKDFDTSIHSDNTLTRNFVLMGNSYTALAKFDDAIRYYKRYLGAEGADALVYYNLGIAAMKGDKNEEACKALTKALDMGESRAAEPMNAVCD